MLGTPGYCHRIARCAIRKRSGGDPAVIDQCSVSRRSIKALIEFLQAFITHGDEHGMAAKKAADAVDSLMLDIRGPRELWRDK